MKEIYELGLTNNPISAIIKLSKGGKDMDVLKKFVGWAGIAIAGFGLVAGAIVATGWVVLIIVGLAISWLATVEWREV